MNRYEQENGAITQHDVPVVVKWYNATKGFGFVQFDDGSPDAFLHVSVVQQSGHEDLPEGTRLVCDIGDGRKGPQVASIVRVEALGQPQSRGMDAGGPRRAAAPGAASGETIEGTVKFFNIDKGFGFVTPDDGGKDVYISARTLERIGVNSLEPQQRVRLSARMGQKGPMADRIELL